jgi:hypothetical protein
VVVCLSGRSTVFMVMTIVVTKEEQAAVQADLE